DVTPALSVCTPVFTDASENSTVAPGVDVSPRPATTALSVPAMVPKCVANVPRSEAIVPSAAHVASPAHTAASDAAVAESADAVDASDVKVVLIPERLVMMPDNPAEIASSALLDTVS